MLIKFTQALHSEQEGTAFTPRRCAPVFTHSEFHDVNGTRAIMKRLPKYLWLTAERVAEDGYRAVM
jgi:short-subunit dehydrogenase